jgi:peptidoglycan hydrolase-like protein with peptidoglycan-binding domain
MLTKNRQLYDGGEDVRALQKFFNTHGLVVAQSGPGSPGNETSIFGTNTYRTLIKFQKSNSLPATSYLGPLTRALINSQTH